LKRKLLKTGNVIIVMLQWCYTFILRKVNFRNAYFLQPFFLQLYAVAVLVAFKPAVRYNVEKCNYFGK